MPWVHQISRVSIKRQGLLSWVVALGLFTGSVAVRVLFEPFLGGMKFMTFWPAIVVTTLICGWRQGAFVLSLATGTAWYFFLEPVHSFAIKDKNTVGALVSFVSVGGFLVLVMAALRETIRRVELAKAVQETLFAELQHRVANNLQLVVALLRNAQRNLRNPVAAAETLTAAEDRIMAMAQLHRRLNDGTAYDRGLEPLLKEMIASAFRELPVTVRIDVSGASDLTIDQMTAMTLLVNEAALNAAKHVFSKGLGSRFEVSLAKDANGRLHLNIKDDGPGSTQTTDAEAGSLGMGIMEAFATQLGGSLEVGHRGGTSLTVEFKNR
ncbi:MAG: histidine kinase dimerization/phosphoacceptor domain -containing protein [Methylocystis sp.]|uniref:histidine kinase dimerization/phosphoacceptor domain -containing protein n=1 Tax=Methylocystis sp. TaxID=1911079 RepID=UPI003DA372E6